MSVHDTPINWNSLRTKLLTIYVYTCPRMTVSNGFTRPCQQISGLVTISDNISFVKGMNEVVARFQVIIISPEEPNLYSKRAHMFSRTAL